jgi:hypothetical protein
MELIFSFVLGVVFTIFLNTYYLKYFIYLNRKETKCCERRKEYGVIGYGAGSNESQREAL